MAIYSMTAFAQVRSTFEQMQILLEIRSVNNRYLDLHLRMPDELRFFEPRLRSLIAERIGRGKLDIRLQVQKHNAASDTVLATEFLQTIAHQLKHIRQFIPDTPTPNFSELFTLAGTHKDLDHEHWLPVLEDVTHRALDELMANRAREGEQLASAMRAFGDLMLTHIETVKTHLPQVQTEYQQRVAQRLQEALEQASPEGTQYISPEEFSARIAQEAAAFSLRIDVAEEITRLEAHVKELSHLLTKADSSAAKADSAKVGNAQKRSTRAQHSSLGKRMDFLFQEMNREANTLGSKAGSIALTQAAIELKLLIEQLREQAQNIE
ncbi:MAG TPA: DUF1732 domain-containing protein [Paenalcaligenes sp.]|nr:DUF1732 domain-containing protein [Paenalcaligenes sp.]